MEQMENFTQMSMFLLLLLLSFLLSLLFHTPFSMFIFSHVLRLDASSKVAPLENGFLYN